MRKNARQPPRRLGEVHHSNAPAGVTYLPGLILVPDFDFDPFITVFENQFPLRLLAPSKLSATSGEGGSEPDPAMRHLTMYFTTKPRFRFNTEGCSPPRWPSAARPRSRRSERQAHYRLATGRTPKGGPAWRYSLAIAEDELKERSDVPRRGQAGERELANTGASVEDNVTDIGAAPFASIRLGALGHHPGNVPLTLLAFGRRATFEIDGEGQTIAMRFTGNFARDDQGCDCQLWQHRHASHGPVTC